MPDIGEHVRFVHDVVQGTTRVAHEGDHGLVQRVYHLQSDTKKTRPRVEVVLHSNGVEVDTIVEYVDTVDVSETYHNELMWSIGQEVSFADCGNRFSTGQLGVVVHEGKAGIVVDIHKEQDDGPLMYVVELAGDRGRIKGPGVCWSRDLLDSGDLDEYEGSRPPEFIYNVDPHNAKVVEVESQSQHHKFEGRDDFELSELPKVKMDSKLEAIFPNAAALGLMCAYVDRGHPRGGLYVEKVYNADIPTGCSPHSIHKVPHELMQCIFHTQNR